MAYSKSRYMELRSRRVPHSLALALASDPESVPDGTAADAVAPISIPEDQDVLLAIEALATRVNQIISALQAAGLMED